MKKRTLALAMAAALGYHGSTFAAPAVEVGGVIEIEAASGEESSDIAVATAELGIAATINEKVVGEVVLLHEAGEPEPIVVDSTTVTLGISDHFDFTAGQSYAPFGVFDSHMISDPLTLELAETGATLLQADINTGNFTTSLYTFNGANATDEEIDNWGANLSYVSERFALALGYIGNIGDTDGIAAETIDSEVPGMSISAGLSLGGLTLIGEHISASDKFQPGDGNANYSFIEETQPSATNVELAYTLNTTTIAIGRQTTDEAEALGLAETRSLAALSHELMENTTIALEYASEEDYAGEESSVVTAQLAVSF